jgi:hypothetical protein
MKWLTSHVGENIDDVFSEWVKLEWIPQIYRNLAGIKIVMDFPVVMDGEICTLNYYRCNSIYVDPITKLIVVPVKTRKKSYMHRMAQQVEEYCKILGDYHQLLKMDGIWYDVEIAPTYNINVPSYNAKTKVTEYKCVTKYTTKRLPATASMMRDSFRTPQIARKKQLSSKELKQYKLSNNSK